MFHYLKTKYLNTSLRRKMVILITLFVTLIPTTLIVILAFAYYKLGIESLFNEKISTSINKTVEIAEQYLKEHKDNIRADVLAIAKGIDENYVSIVEDPDLFAAYLDKEADFKALSEVIVFTPHKMIAKNTFAFAFAFDRIPEAALQKADNGEIAMLETTSNDKVRAVLKLNNFVQTYLLVGMYVDSSILNYLKESQGSAAQYQHLISDLKTTQIKLEIIFVIVFIVLCSLAIMFGVRLASFITRPIKHLVDATEKIQEGDFSIQLMEHPGRDETAVLTRAFNQMTKTLAFQRSELIKVNQLIDERRRFIEKVLTEISAGVIALDASKKITLINYSAISLLGLSKQKQNIAIDNLLPGISDLLEQAIANPDEIMTDNLKITKTNQVMHLLIKAGCIMNNGKVETFIVTFDDITELVAAQRNAAWADVARRIAHEVKNPLTPISLAADRLKTKFVKEIKSDRANFEKYLDTIAKHVQDIGNIVEEFVQFAGVSRLKLQKCNLVKIIEDAIFSQRVVFKDIEYDFNCSVNTCLVTCDETRISQVMINILKNAAESILVKLKVKKANYHGKINISLKLIKASHDVKIEISDNGAGITPEILDKVFEPYVTSKTHGTGVGLAIVKKIIEDHGGSITLKPKKVGITVQLILHQSPVS